jgi:hypothetical protein
MFAGGLGMNRSFLKGAAVGFVCAVLGGATVAFAGSGVGGVFNLGQSNSVDAQTKLTGSTAGTAQLQVSNTNTGAGAIGMRANNSSTAAAVQGESSSTGTGVYGISTNGFGVLAQSSSATSAALKAQNSGGGPAGSFVVNAGVTPFKVSSSTKVASLNADELDGLDSTALQKRVTGTCVAGMAMQVVNADGTVSCLSVGSGGGWSLTGNAGTTPGANFLGTTDAHDLVVKTNNAEALRVTSAGDVGIGTTSPAGRLETDSSTANPAVLAQNLTGTGPAASFNVSGASPPFNVNTTAKVPFLNADYLDGFNSSSFQENVFGTCNSGSAIGAIANDGSVTCNNNHVRPGYTNVGISVNLGAGHCAQFEVVVGGIAVGDTAILVPDATNWPSGLIAQMLRADQVNRVPMNVCNLSASTINTTATVSIWRVLLSP